MFLLTIYERTKGGKGRKKKGGGEEELEFFIGFL